VFAGVYMCVWLHVQVATVVNSCSAQLLETAEERLKSISIMCNVSVTVVASGGPGGAGPPFCRGCLLLAISNHLFSDVR